MMAAKHRRGEEERPAKNKKNASSHKDNTSSKTHKQEEDKRPSMVVVLVCGNDLGGKAIRVFLSPFTFFPALSLLLVACVCPPVYHHLHFFPLLLPLSYSYSFVGESI